MITETYLDKVIRIVKQETDADVTSETKFEDIDIDSLEFIGLLMEISNVTGVDIPSEKYDQLETVADVARLLDSHQS
jgi:acyl carrier protein